MRRYAKAFVEAVKIVRSMKKIEYGQGLADLSAAAKEDFASRSEAAAEASLGPERASNRAAVSSWRLLCSLGSHDFSAMRELLDFVATYETGHDSVGSFDALYGDGKRVRVEYDTPYVKGLPITLTVAESDQSGAYIERVIHTLQYEALHSAIAGNGPVKCSPEDAVQELRTIGLVIDALYPKRLIAE
ncbi:hypothetical protein FA13DRAFT_1746481 [Coprinellus micaceus]|uniref:Uncharacterized protein n=1 Tax=Coprinellus micaceus TaxID=71717 RepID=A0A4Y7SA57_COPMI|nr:hypothetical protein FA13DRAFT_1746481 [Coprinellus micaceus]